MSKGDARPLVEIMAALRTPGSGCPWDLEQDFKTIAPHTIEEAYEVAEAIEHHDMKGLKEELGDLLFQVAYHARMAEEAGQFDFDDVVSAICDKMVRRHPHVFGEERIESAAQQTQAWEAHKAREREQKSGGNGSLMDGISVALPAMSRAMKLQRRAASVGFDWPDYVGVLAKLAEETEEYQAALEQGGEAVQHELGDLLFTLVNLARHQGIEPESALRHANRRFESRFRSMEARALETGNVLDQLEAETLESYWQWAKRNPGT